MFDRFLVKWLLKSTVKFRLGDKNILVSDSKDLHRSLYSLACAQAHL